MASSTSTRIWRVHKAAGRPFPKLVEDDVLDYLLIEAISIKASQEEAKAHKEATKKAEMDAKKKEAISELNKYR